MLPGEAEAGGEIGSPAGLVHVMEYSEDWLATKAYLSEDSLSSLGNKSV